MTSSGSIEAAPAPVASALPVGAESVEEQFDDLEDDEQMDLLEDAEFEDEQDAGF